MEHRPPRRTRPLAAAALFVLPLGGALLLLQALPRGGPPAPDTGGLTNVGSLNGYHFAPGPPGPAGLADLRLQPVALPNLRYYGLSLSSQRGRIVAGEPRPPSARRMPPVLWSGPPAAFSLRAAGRPGSLLGTTGRIDVVGALGTVTVADGRGRTLGTRPVRLITAHETGGIFGGPGHSWAITPEGGLARPGTLRLTYRDPAGRVVGRATVSRAARRGGAHGV